MAASLIQQQKEKRKVSELEDITNNDGRKKLKANFNMYHNREVPQSQQQQQQSRQSQEKSISPTDIIGKPATRNISTLSNGTCKKVTFASEASGKADRIYHESPLLTPKEDYDDDFDENGERRNSTSDLHHDVISSESFNQPFDADLDKNSDYLALSSTLRLLYSSKKKIHSQQILLSQLLEFYSSCSKEEIIEFVMKLINNELDLPGQNKIIRTPLIDWSKYHQCLNVGSKWSKLDNSDDSPMFKTLHLFDK